MPDNHPQLGRVLGEDEGVRDAIHIAIIPVIVGNHMTPGSRVAYNVEADRVFTDTHNTIGVIDPFLPMASLAPGTRVYLFLDPYTITSLSHHWTHPAFPAVTTPASSRVAEMEEAIAYVTDIAAVLHLTYDEMMERADAFAVDEDDYEYDNSERYKDVDWGLFWKRWAIIRQKPVPSHNWAPYTCSC